MYYVREMCIMQKMIISRWSYLKNKIIKYALTMNKALKYNRRNLNKAGNGMKEIIVKDVDGEEAIINIHDIASMEVVSKVNPVAIYGVKINLKNGFSLQMYHDEPEKYIEEYRATCRFNIRKWLIFNSLQSTTEKKLYMELFTTKNLKTVKKPIFSACFMVWIWINCILIL